MVNNDTSHLTAKHLVASGRLTEKQFIFFTICKEEKASQRAKIQKQQKHRERERGRGEEMYWAVLDLKKHVGRVCSCTQATPCIPDESDTGTATM